jgi:hypothetical protein
LRKKLKPFTCKTFKLFLVGQSQNDCFVVVGDEFEGDPSSPNFGNALLAPSAPEGSHLGRPSPQKIISTVKSRKPTNIPKFFFLDMSNVNSFIKILLSAWQFEK